MSCDNCSKGLVLPGDPTGTIGPDGAYLASAPPSDVTLTHAVVLLTDAFGLPLKNCKILADALSNRLGCDVWVPDIFNGDPLFSPDALNFVPDKAGVKTSPWGMLRVVFACIPRLAAIYRSRPSVVDSRIASFITKLREEKKYDKIGAIGYCFGGSCAIRLGSSDLVNSIVVCHPGPCTVGQIKAIKVPAAWACAEEDEYFGKKLRLKAESVFSERKGKDVIEYQFTDYKGTAHGFAARPNLSIPEVKEAFEKSLDQAVEWFNKTLL